MKQQIILFIEPAKEEWKCPESIGNLYLNRFVIDEDAAHEVLGVYYLKKSSAELCDPKHEAYPEFEIERQHKERFDNKMLKRGIELVAKNQSSKLSKLNYQTHIFVAGWVFEEGSKQMEYLSDLIRDHKIPSILLTGLLLNRLRVSSLEDVKSAYKDDRGLTLNRPPDLSKMTEEEIHEASFRIGLKAHH